MANDKPLYHSAPADFIYLIPAVLFYGFLLSVSWLFNLTILPFIFLLAIPFGYYLFRSLSDPFLILILIVTGAYLGAIVHLIDEGVVPVTLFQIFLMLGFLVFILNRLLTRNFEISLPDVNVELFLFLALAFLSLTYTPNPVTGAIFALRLLVLVLTAYLVLNMIDNAKQICIIMVCIAGVSAVLAVVSAREALLNPEAAVVTMMSMPGDLNIRAVGTLRDPNIFASQFFLPIAFVSSAFLCLSQKSYKIMAVIILPVLMAGLLSTFSRSAWVSVALILVIITVFLRQYKLILGLSVLGMLVILAVPELRYTAVNILERLLQIFAGAADDSSRIRLLLGMAALYMFFDSYLLGVGLRGFPEVFPNYFSTQISVGVTEPHNITYEIMAELGLAGLLLFLLIIWKVGSRAYYNVKKSRSELDLTISLSLFAAYIAYLVFYQFYTGGLQDSNIWIIIGLVYALGYILDKKHNAQNTGLQPAS